MRAGVSKIVDIDGALGDVKRVFSEQGFDEALAIFRAMLETLVRKNSALELDTANADAKANAEFVERKIEELLKFKKQVEQQSEQVAEEREKMKEAMKKLRGKIPKEMQRESDDEEDDGDEEDKEDKEPKAGEKQQQRLGSDREVSPDMARWLKETMKRRTMSLGTQQEGEGFRPTEEQRKPKTGKGRDW